MFFKWNRKPPNPDSPAVREFTPEVIVNVRASDEGDGCQRVSIIMHNVKFSYADERGSRLSSDHTSISLDLYGIDSWISFGLFVKRQEEDPEPQVPF